MISLRLSVFFDGETKQKHMFFFHRGWTRTPEIDSSRSKGKNRDKETIKSCLSDFEQRNKHRTSGQNIMDGEFEIFSPLFKHHITSGPLLSTLNK